MAVPSERSRPRPRPAGTWWTRLSPTARHAASLGLLLLIAVAYYAPVLFGGKTISGGDMLNWRANAEALISYYEQTGVRALWNPNTFGGMPAFLTYYKLAIPQLDTLVNALRGAMWPIEHIFMMMAGVYALVVYLRRDWFAGLVSAVAFGFTTYVPIILAAGHQTKFVALAYAPFVLLAFVYTLRNPSLLGGLLFAAALALELRAKHPQITYYVMMVLFVWWIVEVVGGVRDGKTTAIAKSTGWLALGTALALLMVAQPYLATYQYKQFSTRASEATAGGGGGGEGTALGWDYAMRWSQGIAESITLLIADAFGGGGQLYWGPKPPTAGPHYVGGIVAALSGLALWKVKKRVVWGLGAAAGITLLFAWGRHAAWLNWPMFKFFPFFDAFRAPETWLSVTALALAVLAGFGLDYALRSDPTQGRRQRAQNQDPRLRPILISFGVTFGFVALLWLGAGSLFDFESRRESQVVQQIQQRQNLNRSNARVRQFYQQLNQRKEERRAAFSGDAQRTLIFLVLAGLALVAYRRETIPGWAAGLLVVAFVTIDLWGVDTRYLGSSQYSEAQNTEEQIRTYDFDRFIKKRVEEAGGSGHFRVVSLVEGNPSNTSRPSYHYEQIGGYHGAKLQLYQDYLDHILQVGQQGAPNENALDLMNTRYIVAQEQLPGTELAYKGEQSGVLVLRNPDVVPRGFLVGQTEVVSDPQQTWKRLRSSDFDPRRTALLPEAIDAPVTPIDSGSTASVELERHTPPEVEWTINTDAPRLFVASEVYYPAGWNAYLDGEQVPIRRVDYLLRGVHVPEGEHTLVMRFEPQVDRIGTWIAGATTAAVYGGIFVIVGLRVRKRWYHETEESDSDE